MKLKYTKELLSNAVLESTTVSEVIRKLGLKSAGGTHYHIANKIKLYEIDTSHFTGKRSNLGKSSVNKHTKESFLESLKKDNPQNGSRLLKRLKEFGIKEHCCEKCNNKSWMDEDIPLEVDHIDGDHHNNEITNLRVLCPNCHAQTENYCRKN